MWHRFNGVSGNSVGGGGEGRDKGGGEGGECEKAGIIWLQDSLLNILSLLALPPAIKLPSNIRLCWQGRLLLHTAQLRHQYQKLQKNELKI